MRSTALWNNRKKDVEKQLEKLWLNKVSLTSPSPCKYCYIRMEGRLGRMFLQKKHEEFGQLELEDPEDVIDRLHVELEAVKRGVDPLSAGLFDDNKERVNASTDAGLDTAGQSASKARVRFDPAGKVLCPKVLILDSGIAKGVYVVMKQGKKPTDKKEEKKIGGHCLFPGSSPQPSYCLCCDTSICL